MLIAAGIALAGPAALSAAPELAETRSALKEWVEIKKLISEESSKWVVEKETLNESIDLLQKEIDKLQAAIERQEEEQTDAERVRAELTREEEALKQASAIVKNNIGDLEAQALELVKYLPKALQSKLTIITQRIPKNKREIDASTLSNRVMSIIGILTEIEKFNSQITVENEIQDINGEKVRVDTIYIGLAVAYYVDGTQTEAGYMLPAKDGWTKVPNNALAPKIANAVAMQKKEMTVNFVNLPIEITDIQ
ncbi:DUF3450 family protein [Pelagicoccus sp. SDUM812003]|uniref:DUF3450 family protein n=1 Tax=Pelagicoccus sp. SDUM812003 TaxID=3041267 RepID=UPI002810DACD|nr:DUF3450 family protein [Pelagicoccus sp. SDUM812003]